MRFSEAELRQFFTAFFATAPARMVWILANTLNRS